MLVKENKTNKQTKTEVPLKGTIKQNARSTKTSLKDSQEYSTEQGVLGEKEWCKTGGPWLP